MYKQEQFHTIPDTADNDFTIPTAHWTKKNDSRLIWQQGHAERREKDPNKRTNDEWAKGEADRLAGQAWEEAFSQIQNQANASRLRHAGGIQVITSEGLIAGQIPKRLLELLTTECGLPALQKATQLSDEAIELLDNEATLRGASEQQCTQSRTGRSFTPTTGPQQAEHANSNKQNQQNVNAAEIE